ncbi:EpsG family protein [Grimontia hollisae]|uniref:EpsG family protein n=1 Tax=Grimontia hollisae TaxID=673 RepID=UPI0023DC0E22|nr:EpsG family protein [Grimontia hollisae]MDF2184130.1 EpsG family protein [Grimontia hollisae]
MLDGYRFIPYAILVLSFFFTLVPSNPKFHAFRHLALLLSVSSMALIVGFRDMYAGSDTISYAKAFEELSRLVSFEWTGVKSAFISNNIYFVDFLFAFFSFSISRFTDDFNVYLSILLIISLLILAKAYKRLLPEDYLFSLAVFFCSFTFVFIFGNAIRQSLAVSIIALAVVKLFLDRDSRTFFVLVFLASLFHIYAFLFFPAIVLVKLKKISVFLVPFLCIALSLIIPQVGTLVFDLLGLSIFSEKISAYFNGSEIFGFNFISGLLFLVVSFFLSNLSDDKRADIVFRIYATTCSVQFLTLGSEIAFARLGGYRFIWEPVLAILLITVIFNSRIKSTLAKYAFMFMTFLYFHWVSSSESVMYTLGIL